MGFIKQIYYKLRKQESLSSFVDRIEDFDLLQKHGKRSNKLKNWSFEDLTFLPYQDLKHEIPELIKQSKFENAIFRIVKAKFQAVTIEEIEAIDNVEKLHFWFWIQEQYELIQNLEQQYLNTPPDPKLVNAGIRDLDVLEDVNLIDSLAQGDILKWNEIRQLPYSMIFDKQLRNTILGKIDKKLAQQKK